MNTNEYTIYDVHCHIFPQKIAHKAANAIGDFYETKMKYDGDSETLLKSAANISVKKMLVCSTATVPEQTTTINNFIKEECNKHPEFLGFGTLHPDFEDIEKETQRIIDLGLHGIKLHPDFQKFNIDDPKAYKIYECAEGKLPLLIHMGDDRYEYSRPHRLAKVMSDFPKLQVIAAHFGGYKNWDEAINCLLGIENIVFDTSSTLGFNDIEFSKKLVSKFDTNKLMFGTDFPMWDHKEELQRFLSLGLSYEQNKKILCENFKKYFNIK